MNSDRQIFQTTSRLRWHVFIWFNRLALALVFISIIIVLYSIYESSKPDLPQLQQDRARYLSQKPAIPKTLSKRDDKRFHGFADLLSVHVPYKPQLPHAGPVRAAFYVDWDPQSLYSLKRNIGQLNMVLPEWFFIDPSGDSIKTSIDADALRVLRQHAVSIVPILNNINLAKGEGEFDGALLHRVLHDPIRREHLIQSIIQNLQQYHLQGINIDFEEMQEKSDEALTQFQQELYARLHPMGLLVTQDIMPSNSDFDAKALSRYNDFLFVMAYDEYYSSSIPGPVSAQRWIEKTVSAFADLVPENKLIVCLAGYGYDWADGEEAETITYQQAMALAKEYKVAVDYDNDSYNCHFSYTDAGNIRHQVYFTDAAGNFNTMRFSDELGAAGTALWRLGSEDERLWRFYARDLSNRSLAAQPFSYDTLQSSALMVDQPDYVGDGEVLNVISEPQAGKMNLEIDSINQIVAEEKYIDYPTNYVIRKFGNVHNQVILTFDDGPDPEYTPEILDILKKEKVPATFFIVGMNGEENLPLLKRIWKEGHEIGNHTFTHPNIAEVGDSRAYMEMESTRRLIESAIGRSTILFRAPYNADAEPTRQVELKPVAISKMNNYYTVGESIDPNDWDKGVTAMDIYTRVIRQYERNPSKGIILLHDAGGDRHATVQALPWIINYFKKRGVAFTTVSKLLNEPLNRIMPPVSDKTLAVDSRFASVGFMLTRFLELAFWAAIVLGIGRIVLLGGLAGVKYWRERRFGKRFVGRQTSVDGESVTGRFVGRQTSDERQNDLMRFVGRQTSGEERQTSLNIIVPAYNEELNAVRTVSNLLQQTYPNFSILFIDDGSTDKTYEKVSEAFKHEPRVTVLTKVNGGKASALNLGIEQSTADYVVCIDADTQLHPDAVAALMRRLESDPTIGAVAGNVKVGNEVNLLTRWQSIEYITAQNFDRRAFDLVNGITVVPGAIGAFRKQAILDAGGFTSDTLAEDCDLTIRILRQGYRVVNCPEAIAVTEAPETLRQFMKQRFRWSYGIMQSFWKNRDACFRPSYKALGMLSLPNLLFFQILLPILAPVADLMLLFNILWSRSANNHKMLGFYLLFLAVDLIIGVMAFRFEKQDYRKLIWIIPQRFIYRQLMYVVLFRALRKAIKGEGQGWGALLRTGNASMEVLTGLHPATEQLKVSNRITQQ